MSHPTNDPFDHNPTDRQPQQPYHQPYGQQPYDQPYGQQPFQPQPSYGASPIGVRPETHLGWSIGGLVFSLFCCFWSIVPSVVALVYSIQVDSRTTAGDIKGAERASNTARTWNIVSFAMSAVGIVLVVLYFVFYVVLAAA